MPPATGRQDQPPAGFPPPRVLGQRQRDAKALLKSETTAWVATSGQAIHMVPLLFFWDGTRLTLATTGSSLTVANLRQHPRARMAVGQPYDLAMIDAATELIPAGRIAPAVGDAFAALLHGGPDPRTTPDYIYIQATPVRIQAWRHVGELHGRTLMRNGTWLVPCP